MVTVMIHISNILSCFERFDLARVPLFHALVTYQPNNNLVFLCALLREWKYHTMSWSRLSKSTEDSFDIP